MNSKAFIVLLVFVMLIAVLGSGSLGSADLTPYSPPAENTTQLEPVVAGASTNLCGSPYRVQTGDSLSMIARRCGIVLDVLLAANPTITNPNFIRAGQEIVLPAPQADLSVLTPAPTATPALSATLVPGIPPETQFTIEISNLPSSADVKIGVGLAGAGYTVIGEGVTDQNGKLNAQIAFPPEAVPGQNWTVTVITTSNPPIEITSAPVQIGSKP